MSLARISVTRMSSLERLPRGWPDQEGSVLPRSTPFHVSRPPSAPTRTFFLHRAFTAGRFKPTTRCPSAAVPAPLLSWLLQQLQQFLAGFGFKLLCIEGTIVVGIGSFELRFDELEVLILRECALGLPKPKAALLHLLIKQSYSPAQFLAIDGTFVILIHLIELSSGRCLGLLKVDAAVAVLVKHFDRVRTRRLC